MKTQKISTKIKTLGALLVFLTLCIIGTTIYLNENNTKDALIINIVGKQRMLTQKIAKNVFYLHQTKSSNFIELDAAIQEFVYSLNSLKNGNDLLGIKPVPTENIATQFYIIDIIWNNYNQNVQDFKRELLLEKDNYSKHTQLFVDTIYNTNTVLLKEVDNLVHLYTLYAENKTKYLKYFQYGAALVLLLLFLYGFIKLKEIEQNAQNFIDSTKKLILSDEIEHLKPIDMKAEREIVEVSDTINCFINKINSAMEFSTSAIEQSKQAANKLEEITDEFDKILDDLKDSATISKQLNKSEDMVIESTEDLIASTKRLQELKNELDKLKAHCQNS
ncbi:MAG: type IV pili methyl-accepting chemotaxis transducer N-terminal domain-containing protein [Arcobacteraceae bacterium]